MSEHTHLAGIEVNGDKIQFSFTQHNDQPISGLEIPQNYDAARFATQLRQMEQLSLLSPEQLQAITGQPGIERLAELYKPVPRDPPAQVPPVLGDHTASYLAQQQAAADPKKGARGASAVV